MARRHRSRRQNVANASEEYITYELNGKTVTRRRPQKRTSTTPKRSRNEQDFFGNASLWNQCSFADKAAWGQIARRVAHWNDDGNPVILSGYQCYMAVQSGRRAQSLPLLTQAPRVPDQPPFLETPVVTATLTASAPNGFVLEAVYGPFPCAVSVFAARPAIPGSPPASPKNYALLCTLPALESGAASLGAAYAKQWNLPPDGAQINLRFVPISPLGFRGQAVPASGIVETTL